MIAKVSSPIIARFKPLPGHPRPDLVGRCQMCHNKVEGDKTSHNFYHCGSRTKYA